jgi:AraC-like DNA-binding protein
MLRNDFEAFYYSDSDLPRVEPHRHSFYELLFFVEGDVTYMVEDTPYPLLPGDLLIIPCHTRHQPIFRGNSRYRRVVLWLTPDFIRSLQQGEELMLEPGQKGRLCRFSPADASRLLECAMSIADESSYERPFGNTMSVLLITQLLILIHRMLPASTDHGQNDSASQQLVNDVVSFINHNLSLDLTLDYLADRFFISKFYLSRVFKKHMQVTPHSYISQRRLVLAKQLLYKGLPPIEVYKRCGYSDYSSFFRAFKEKYGFSPKQLFLQNE